MAYPDETRDRLAADAAAVVARYPDPHSALLPLLHLVQSEDGYVSPDGIAFCAETLAMSTAEVSAVATFYTQYKRHPNGEYTVGVCTNTLCAIMGGDEIYRSLSEHLGVGHDETTEDGAITLERLECNAACDYAPVVMVNWEFFDNQTPDSAREIADRLRAGEPVRPDRGADSVVSFREASRVLAGFPDGRAGEGPAAGEASLVGLKIAREKGWVESTTTTASAPSAVAEPRPGGEHSSVDRPAADPVAASEATGGIEAVGSGSSGSGSSGTGSADGDA